MTMEVRHPLSMREAGLAASREGVPPVMDAPLRAWIRQVALRHATCIERVRTRTDLLWDDEAGTDRSDWDRLGDDTPSGKLLDVTDAMLDLLPRPNSRNTTWKVLVRGETQEFEYRLQQLLDDARSIYTIARDGRSLERRVSVTIVAAVGCAAAAAQTNLEAGSAPAQLRCALGTLQARNPDTEKAYREAVKAVESAAHAVVEPTNPRATLGTMLRIMRDDPDHFRLAITSRANEANAGPIIEIIRLLWEGQTSRHGGRIPTRPENLEEAEMALPLAATLVEWFTTGKVCRRRPGEPIINP